jgi:hypothetical protein
MAIAGAVPISAKVGLYGRYSCEGEYLRGLLPNVQKQSVGSIMLTIRRLVPQMIIDDPHENGLSHSEWELQILPSGKIPASFKTDPQGKMVMAGYAPETKQLVVDFGGIALFATCYRFPNYDAVTIPAQQPVAAPLPAIAPSAEWCGSAFKLLAISDDAYVKQALLEKMRNRGCLQ